MHLNFEGRGYTLGVEKLKANQTVEIDFRKLRDEQVPDEMGNLIPLNLDKGQIAWSVKGGVNKILSGRSEQISLSRGLASTYSCANCCADSVFQTGILPTGTQFTAVGGIEQFAAQQRDINCMNQFQPWYYPADVIWESTEIPVALIDGDGLAEAVGTGQSIIRANWESVTWTNFGTYCDPTYNSEEEAVIMEVAPQIADISPDAGFAGKTTKVTITGAGFKISSTVEPAFSESPITVTSFEYHSLTKIFASFVVNTNAFAGAVPIKVVTDGVSSNTRSFHIATPPTSLLASMPSTNSGDGTMSTQNTNIDFVSGTSPDDFMVVFKGADYITVSAKETNPTSAEGLIKWQVDRDTGNTESGVPTLNTAVGATVDLTPNVAGNFRLIAYYVGNDNGTFDTGEQVRVLRFAVIRIFVGECQLINANTFSTPVPLILQVSAGEVRRECELTLEGGGSQTTVGLDKVKVGLITNIYLQTYKVFYNTGSFSLLTEGVLPQAYKHDDDGSPSAGVFRDGNDQTGSNRFILYEKEEISPSISKYHPDNETPWISNGGGPAYEDFIAAVSTSFPDAYVVVAKATFTVSFSGIPDVNLDWQNNGALVWLNGTGTSSSDFSVLGSGGAVVPGRTVTTTNGQSLNVTTFYPGGTINIE